MIFPVIGLVGQGWSSIRGVVKCLVLLSIAPGLQYQFTYRKVYRKPTVSWPKFGRNNGSHTRASINQSINQFFRVGCLLIVKYWLMKNTSTFVPVKSHDSCCRCCQRSHIQPPSSHQMEQSNRIDLHLARMPLSNLYIGILACDINHIYTKCLQKNLRSKEKRGPNWILGILRLSKQQHQIHKSHEIHMWQATLKSALIWHPKL